MDQSDRFFDFACRLLARRDYFTEELRQKIIAKGATEEESAAAIEKLNRFNYLDDTKVLRKYVSEIISKGKGINYLKQKLYEKGCSSLLYSLDLTEFYPFGEEVEAAKKALAKLGKCEEEKLVPKLVSRGFSLPAALDAVKKRKR
ncbi:RecX family transcriptional regulator [bacterium]|nr:RecX family transcriptional regulator [bacterium]